jgi:hypothetical protein
MGWPAGQLGQLGHGLFPGQANAAGILVGEPVQAAVREVSSVLPGAAGSSSTVSSDSCGPYVALSATQLQVITMR